MPNVALALLQSAFTRNGLSPMRRANELQRGRGAATRCLCAHLRKEPVPRTESSSALVGS